MLNLTIKLAVMMLVAALCLGVTNMVTAEPIERQKAIQSEALRLEVLPEAESLSPVEIAGAPSSLKAAYESDAGYVFEMTASGFGGAMDVTVGITAQGEIAGVRVGSHSETPGLGAKATDEAFFGQYTGQAAAELSVVKLAPATGEIQAITAATITSKAVTDAVNDAVSCYNLATSGGAR